MATVADNSVSEGMQEAGSTGIVKNTNCTQLRGTAASRRNKKDSDDTDPRRNRKQIETNESFLPPFS